MNPMICRSLQRHRRFYRSGPTFWHRYRSFWPTSLLNQIVFFVIPVVAALIPVFGFALPFYRWLHILRIDQLHRALGNLERELAQSAVRSRFVEYQKRISKIESAVRLLKAARPFEVDLHRLRVHLRMVQEDINRMQDQVDGATNQGATRSDEERTMDANSGCAKGDRNYEHYQTLSLGGVPVMENVRTRELYSSSNGDRWHLCRNASGKVFVLHEANIPAGGRISQLSWATSLQEDTVLSNRPSCK
jgi:hypothetical protein